jgi:hypothetical protein
MKVPRKNFPVGNAGQYKGREDKPSTTCEAVCDDKLAFTLVCLSISGVHNDLNVFDASPIVTITSRPALAMCTIGYAGPPTPSKIRMYSALATRAGAPLSRP